MNTPSHEATPMEAALSHYLAACGAWAPLKREARTTLQGEALEQVRAAYQQHRDALLALRAAIHAECQAGRFVVGTLKSGEQVTIGTLGTLVHEDEQFYSERKDAELAGGSFLLRELVSLSA